MKFFSAVLATIGSHPITMREVLAEAFFLGNRHKGEILEGAHKGC